MMHGMYVSALTSMYECVHVFMCFGLNVQCKVEFCNDLGEFNVM